MGKLQKWIKSEIDVELFCCVWAMTMICVYGFELYLYGEKSVKFGIIIQMFILSYGIAWFQKLLFLTSENDCGFVLFRNQVNYSREGNGMRKFLWIVAPNLITLAVATVFQWFHNYPLKIAIIFYGVMFVCYISIWIILQLLNSYETNQLNDLLDKIKQDETEA